MKIKGFTLIELLVVIAVLGLLSLVTINVVNPVEQINKAKDVAQANIMESFYAAIERSIVGGGIISQSSDTGTIALNSEGGLKLTQSLIDRGELKTNFLSTVKKEGSSIFLTLSNSSSSVSICFQPKSDYYQKEYNCIGDDCSACISGGEGIIASANNPSATATNPPQLISGGITVSNKPSPTPTIKPVYKVYSMSFARENTPCQKDSSHPNLIKNYSFEIDSDNNKIPDDWTWEADSLRGQGGKLAKGEGVICDSASDGKCSFRFIYRGSGFQRAILSNVVFNPIKARVICASFDVKPTGVGSLSNVGNIYWWTIHGNVGAQPFEIDNHLPFPTGTSNNFNTVSVKFTLNHIYADGILLNEDYIVNKINLWVGIRGGEGYVDADNLFLSITE